MQLNAACLRNLEIFQNLTDGKENGSLISIIDRTKTKFGSRLLRQWLGRPLLDVKYVHFILHNLASCLLSQLISQAKFSLKHQTGLKI